VSLFTSTPVLKINKSSSGQSIETSRGSISASNVILCTNAHTPHLFPETHPLKNIMYSCRIQMGLFTPPADFTGTKHLSTSYGFPGGYCATSAGGVVVGIGASDYIAAGVGKTDYYVGNSDVTRIESECTECKLQPEYDTDAGRSEGFHGADIRRMGGESLWGRIDQNVDRSNGVYRGSTTSDRSHT
jgi:glycine/D-amino acid oxidase-like deaminating enzyme